MKFFTKALAAISVCLSLSAMAQTPDVSFGTGDLNGWTASALGTHTGPYGDGGGSGTTVATVNGTQTISCCGSNVWTISPYTGSYMVGLQPNSVSNYSAMTTALGLSSASITALNGQVASTGGSITSTAWISKDFTFAAGTTFKMAWVYTSTDYVPFNDGSIATLVNKNSATTFGTINGVSAQYILLGATNPGTGNYSTGSYGSTGWEVINYSITTAGDYKVGFGVFNQGDTALSPVLFVNDNLGTVTKNGTAFGAVASNDPTMPTGSGSSAPTVTGTTTTNSVTTSSVNGTPVVTTAVAYGATTTAVDQTNSRGSQTPQKLTVTQTTTVTNTTPVTITTTTTTPVTTTTTTTPVTVTTYSDNTTTTANGTPVVTVATTNTVTSSSVDGLEIDQTQNNQDYTTRIDQFAKLLSANNRMNESLESDPYTRIRVEDGQIHQRDLSGRSYNFYVTGTGLQSNTKDTYNYAGSVFGLGIEKVLDATTLVGAQYNHGQVNLTGDAASGTLNKDSVGVYVIKSFDNDIMVKGDIGYAQNTYNTAHSLPELNLANAASASGYDSWAQVKVYSPAVAGFRAFVGGRSESNHINSATETGSAVSAMTYAATTQVNNSGIAGLRYDHNFNKNWAVGAEVGHYTNNTTASAINFTYHDDKNSSVLLKIARQDQYGQAVNTASLQARVNF
jgi:hypothetical protein